MDTGDVSTSGVILARGGALLADGGSEMAARARALDWSQTPLGAMDRWPQGLRTAVGICLNSRFPMFVWWGPDLVNIYNDAYIPVLGKRHPDALGKPARQIWHEIWPVIGPQADAVMTRGEATWNERVLLVMERHGYTEDTYFTWSYSPIADDQGGIGGVFCACTEETARVRAEADRDRLLSAVESERTRLAEAFAQSPAFVAILREPDHRFEFANERYLQLVGRREILGRSVLEALPEVRAQGFIEMLDEVYATGQPRVGWGLPIFLHRQPGQPPEQRLVDFVYQPLRDASGVVNGILVHGVDITERHRAETALRESEARFRQLADAMPQMVFAARPDGEVDYFNRQWYEYTGLPEGSVGFEWWKRVHTEDGLFRALKAWPEAVRTGRTYEIEYPLRRHDGQYRWHLGRAVPVRDQAGKIVRWFGTNTDIHDRKTAEEALRDSERAARELAAALTTERGKLAAVIEDLPVGVGIGDIHGQTLSLNRAGLDLHGFKSEAEMFRRLEDYMTEFELCQLDGQQIPVPDWPVSRARRGEFVRGFELLLRNKVAGTERVVSYDVVPVRNQGAVVLFVYVIQDLTRRKHAERELRLAKEEAERASEAKSEFLATLSHELRTPLTPVLLTVSLMESDPELPESLRADVASIRRNVELESRLISDLLDLTRIAKGKLQLDVHDVDLHVVVRSAVDICQREASAPLVLDLRARRHTVRGDATRLQQVFWNLVNNAIKFTPSRGTITVRSSDVADDRVRVEVIDTGVGIDPCVLPRLFNAFEQGEARSGRRQAGLGLGLAISRKLVEAHGGTIGVASAGRGQGATFTVELPVVDVHVARELLPPQSDPAGAATAALRVLLIEDHEPTLRVLERLLVGLGHRVTGARSVAAATAAIDRDGFDVIISDLGLPDGSGLDVMRHLGGRYAGRAIALTGYGMESDVAATRDAGFALHLTKPVDLEKLQAGIAAVTRDAAGHPPLSGSGTDARPAFRWSPAAGGPRGPGGSDRH